MADQKAKCPECGAPRVQEWRPFCSKRCADRDLGHWLNGDYAIAGEPAEDAVSAEVVDIEMARRAREFEGS